MHKVAVITRTLNRERTLARAFESVRSQTMKDFVWIVVNDGGDKAPVDEIVNKAVAAGIAVTVIHHDRSHGMEAASNIGIRAGSSRYVVIHDDDDTWRPDFLDAVTDLLDRQPGHAGAISHTTIVSERITPDAIVGIGRAPHRPGLNAIHLADMARANLFHPIAFVYRRDLYDRIGGYDETMNVLGDWDFNLRMLMEGDIAVVPKALANYHVRPHRADRADPYANTVVASLPDHTESDAAFRNRHIRRDIATGTPGLGMLLALGRLQSKASTTAGPSTFRKVVQRLKGIPR
ncbi:hypothetical protein BH10PSE7_BH10PSE7_28970 [soil metagenome]